MNARRTPRHDQAAIRAQRANAASARSISPASLHIDGLDLHPERRRHCTGRRRTASISTVVPGSTNDRNARHARHDLLEQLQPFAAASSYSNDSNAGDVAARPREAVDEAGADRIGASHEHDRHRCGCRLCSGADVAAVADDERPARAQPIPPRACECARHRRRPNGCRSRTLRPSAQPNSRRPLQKRREAGLSVRTVRSPAMSTPTRRIRSAAARAPRAATPPPRRRAA